MEQRNSQILAIFSCVFSEKLVIDTDGGADDAAAILLALSAYHNDDSDYVAITVVNGNVDQKTAQTNVLKVLTVANDSNVRLKISFGNSKKYLKHLTL